MQKIIFVIILFVGAIKYGTAQLDGLSNIVDITCDALSAYLASIIYGNVQPRPNIDNIYFVLHLPSGKVSRSVRNAASLKDVGFDTTKKTVFYMSGYLSQEDGPAIKQLADNFNCRTEKDYNFVYVDATRFMQGDYFYVVSLVREIGQIVAVGTTMLESSGDRIYFVGHSLGAQIAGYTARYRNSLTTPKVSRITGLDPARPCFRRPSVYVALSFNDATFVDIHHTNPYRLGIEDNIGHADVYYQGLDRIKPGCDGQDFCSHSRSVEYFTETVPSDNANNFIGTKCDTRAQLQQKTCTGASATVGWAMNAATTGMYNVNVNPVAPYGQNAPAPGPPLSCPTN